MNVYIRKIQKVYGGLLRAVGCGKEHGTAYGSRLRYYAMRKLIFFCEDETQRYYLESKCHEILYEEAIGSLSEASEWYEVDKDTYLDICNKGFAFFKEWALERYATGTLLAIKEKDDSTRTLFRQYAKEFKEIAALLS